MTSSGVIQVNAEAAAVRLGWLALLWRVMMAMQNIRHAEACRDGLRDYVACLGVDCT